MTFQNLCPPALIYLVFSITQIVIDTIKGMYNTALIKIWVAFIFTILLNYLCQLGLGIISWFIVFIPFLLMTLVVAILLLMFGLDPATGKIKILDNKKNHQHNPKQRHHKGDNHGRGRNKNKGEREDDVMNYYDSGAALGGGGGSITEKPLEDESMEEKTNRKLKKSLLFYSETDGGEPGTKFKKDDEHLDTTKYELFVDKIDNMLSGIGESEIAQNYKTNSIACINSAKKMKKDDAINSINNCQEELKQGIVNQLTGDKLLLFKKNMKDLQLCGENESKDDCNDREEKNWWN